MGIVAAATGMDGQIKVSAYISEFHNCLNQVIFYINYLCFAYNFTLDRHLTEMKG
jgi:hypothetical protein